MSGTTLERRRLLGTSGGGGGSVEAPPIPVAYVYPSKGNTLTISGSRSSDIGRSSAGRSSDSTSITVTNSSYNSWTNPTAGVLVNMTDYDIIYSTKAGTTNTNMVWCYTYCPDTVGATINAKVTYTLSTGTTTVENLSFTTTSSTTNGFISLSLNNNFAAMTGGVSPNYGHPFLDKTNVTSITVELTATKDGVSSATKSFTIYIQNTTITLSAPTFSPGGGTYLNSQTVTITGDPNYSNQAGFSTHWCTSQTATDPTTSNSSTQTATINSTCYLNAKSFLNLGNGTTIESATTSQLYTISTPSQDLLPPTFNPSAGTYQSSVDVYINNPNSASGVTYQIRYTLDGSTPTENSQLYGGGITITSTTTVKAVVVNVTASPHVVSRVAIATYTIESQFLENYVSEYVNSDTPTTCGDFVIAKNQSSGNQELTYGFSIWASNRSSVVYFTTDGTEPTTSSQSMLAGQWYYLLKPNTTLVKYLVVAPYCADVTGSLWILVNKALATFQYGGRPFLLGPIGNLNWYSDSENNYNEDSSCYIYAFGERLDPVTNDKLSVQQVNVTIDGETQEVGFLAYTPPSGTAIDSTFSFVYGYSAPVKYWEGRCPYSPFFVMNGLSGTFAGVLTAARTIANTLTGPQAISFSSNEIDTLCCAWQLSLYSVNFGGVPNKVSSCRLKTTLDYGAFTATVIEHLDLTPCTSILTIADFAMSGTVTGTNFTQTALVDVLMPYGVSSLGEMIFSKYASTDTRRPLTVTFYNPVVPSASYDTFKEYNTSSALIGNTSTVVVSSVPSFAVVCDYEDAWHYHTPRAGTGTGSTTNQNKTDMKIVDENGLECGEYPPGSIPTATTGTPGSVTSNSATISGNSYTNPGGLSISQKGVCYSTSHSPVYWNSHVAYTGSNTSWNASLAGLLEPETTYYVRAYVVSEAGVSYGDEKSFTTSAATTFPTLTYGHIQGNTVNHLYNFSTNTMTIGSKVVSDGGSQILERKMFMKFSATLLPSSEYPTPTNYDKSVSQNATWTEGGTECIEFVANLSSLSGIPQSGYAYFATFARNSVGWSYRYAVNSVQYDLNTSVQYPTITLSNPIHSEGTLEVPNVRANADVTCGTYGSILVQTYVSTAANAEPGDSTVVGPVGEQWRYYDSTGTHTTSTINSDGIYEVFVQSNDLQLSESTVYYLRSRVRQSQNNHWVYSNSVQFMKWNQQITGFNTTGSSDITFDTAKLSAAGTVYPAKPWYGIVYEKVSSQNTHYLQKFYMSESSATNKSLTITAGNLTPETQYIYRSFVSPTEELNWSTAELGTPMYFTTSTEPATPYYNVNSGNTRSSKRVPAQLNLSFERGWSPTNFAYYYGWGGSGWNAINADWHFENTWEYIGNSNGNNDGMAGHKRDLFGWGTSSQPHRNDDYEAWSTDETNTYNAYNSYIYNLTETGESGMANWAWQKYRSGNHGWGTSRDQVWSGCGVLDYLDGWYTGNNGGDTWRGDVKYYDVSRPLTRLEMTYLLFYRNTTSGIRYCKGRIDHGDSTYTNGLIILGEAWRTSYYTLNQTDTPSAPYTSNTITEANWNSKFKTGNRAIFIPAAGYRKKKSVYNVNSEGWYWLNDFKDSNNAYCLKFNSSTVEVTYKPKYYGLSVRLWRAYGN